MTVPGSLSIDFGGVSWLGLDFLLDLLFDLLNSLVLLASSLLDEDKRWRILVDC